MELSWLSLLRKQEPSVCPRPTLDPCFRRDDGQLLDERLLDERLLDERLIDGGYSMSFLRKQEPSGVRRHGVPAYTATTSGYSTA
jgi:hypothetical protein